ncbi:DEAD/DEAH box helicase [Acidiphilium acidophilum]|uniref:Helicase associated domain protein n=1 Tax=Acidiphilium acidophilum TaxID=76588 RepID=A0AAW9DLF9_ACIAO|nr:Helicase associated domain protein [Acidiphilium acidophilum]MDX5929434.1 Helicase associated domain protein [Acidiphilium acidophilum]
MTHLASLTTRIAQCSGLTLEPHQSEAVDCVLEAWTGQDRATVVMACGTGKTIVGLTVASKAIAAEEGASVGVFVPSLGLIKQIIQVWREFQPWGDRLRVIAVCSDAGVEADDIPPDEIPAVVTTDASALCRFITEAPPCAVNVIFSTYHSAWVVADALTEMRQALDIGIADEAHNTAGAADKSFGLMLHDHVLPIRKRLFMTATPRIVRRVTGEVASMDDAAIYGPIAYNLSFRRAVERGIICDWEVLISVVTRDEAQAIGLARAVHGLSGERLQEAAGRAAIAKAIESVGIKKAISFHNTILAARDFAQNQSSNDQAMPGFHIFHVNGADKVGRREAMSAFAGAEKALVSNARCLTEGVDIPAIDLIAFLGRKSSKIDIIQAIGRALRKAPGKTKGYILLPVLLDPRTGQTPEDALAESDLSLIWDVLAAMRDNDELFAENIITAGRGFQEGPPTTVLSPGWVRFLGEVDLEAIRRGIEVIALDELLFPFDHGYRHLVDFANNTGHGKVPIQHVEPDGFKLGIWVASRRKNYRQGVLSAERIAALEAIPGWTWDVLNAQWDQGIFTLRAFVEREGHANIHSKHVEPDGFKLGNWVGGRRKEYLEGILSAERIAALEAIPGWTWSVFSARWDDGMIALRAFVEREGHTKVRDRYVEPDGFKLGIWVGSRRYEYRLSNLMSGK